ncbi:MAG: hypothetical protein EXR43_04015 [Dehalococcoidia bacterium]|nr:hypothetical protein [Dehalococcoidia bacterium]
MRTLRRAPDADANRNLSRPPLRPHRRHPGHRRRIRRGDADPGAERRRRFPGGRSRSRARPQRRRPAERPGRGCRDRHDHRRLGRARLPP